jgi:predicted phosphodiesterase
MAVERPMKILFTADLHLNIPARSRRTGHTAFSAFAESVSEENPDAVVVAGDIGIPDRAAEYLGSVRKVVGDRPLAVCLGNHDFWVRQSDHPQFASLNEVAAKFWREPTRAAGAVLLDDENADLGEVAVCGGYGHFDLGLAIPNLQVRGLRVNERIYLSGRLGGLTWKDFPNIPNCGTRLQADAREQADGIARRIDNAIEDGKRVLVAVHTCPWAELNGHPRNGNELDILPAYSGNSLVGHELELRAAAIEFLICGHTHALVRERAMHGIPQVMNVGGDYGYYRGVIYETGAKSLRWVGEPQENLMLAS